MVIEPAFGGSAQSWHAIAETLARQTTVVTYDRAPYGASSHAMDRRTPREIARDLHGVLDATSVARPIVLVGHSLGGVCVRAFTALYGPEVAGMVLVDSSHEAQEEVLRESLSCRIRLAEAVMVPVLTADQALAEGALGNKPLVVLTRGPGDGGTVPEDWRRWHGLHEELARLSANSRHIVTHERGHYIHKSEPDLVTAAIRDVLRSARTQTPLADSAAVPPGAG